MKKLYHIKENPVSSLDRGQHWVFSNAHALEVFEFGYTRIKASFEKNYCLRGVFPYLPLKGGVLG
jgi:hypothetical protein